MAMHMGKVSAARHPPTTNHQPPTPAASLPATSSPRAKTLGIPEGTPVSPGGGDNMMSALGCGCSVKGRVAISLGTSGVIFAKTDGAAFDKSGAVCPFLDATGGGLPLTCTLNCASVPEEVVAAYGMSREEITALAEKVTFWKLASFGNVHAPWHRDTATPRHRDTATPRHRDTATPRHRAHSALPPTLPHRPATPHASRSRSVARASRSSRTSRVSARRTGRTRRAALSASARGTSHGRASCTVRRSRA